MYDSIFIKFASEQPNLWCQTWLPPGKAVIVGGGTMGPGAGGVPAVGNNFVFDAGAGATAVFAWGQPASHPSFLHAHYTSVVKS